MRRDVTVIFALAVLVGAVASANAQERFRISVNAGQQATSTAFTEEQNFDQYFEQGSFSFDRTVPKAPFYDAAVAVRLWRGLHAGAAVSIFADSGAGSITARVPHPFFFDQQRTATGEIAGVKRRETGQHVTAGWVIPVSDRLDVLVFGGPSAFSAEQLFVTTLTLGLDKEVFPFDELAFPGAVTEKRRETIIGYNAGFDVTWRFIDKLGAGLLVRYTNGRTEFTPTGGRPVKLEVGGLHAGGGLRLIF